jgi:hypothetical protein
MRTPAEGGIVTVMGALEDRLFRLLDSVFNFGNPRTPAIPRDRTAENRRLRAIERLGRWRQRHAA